MRDIVYNTPRLNKIGKQNFEKTKENIIKGKAQKEIKNIKQKGKMALKETKRNIKTVKNTVKSAKNTVKTTEKTEKATVEWCACFVSWCVNECQLYRYRYNSKVGRLSK